MIAPERNGVTIWLPQYQAGYRGDVYKLDANWYIFRCNPTPVELSNSSRPDVAYDAEVWLRDESLRWDDKWLLLVVRSSAVNILTDWTEETA